MRTSNRREFVITALGGVAAAALLGACGGGGGGVDSASETSGTGSDTNADTCTLYPEETEGPFYLDLGLLRSDITDGVPGTPLSLSIRVVGASDCTPIANAVVDVWHADASGVYSGEASQGTAGETFLRGSQVSDADGQVTFQTVYPGWYSGRTTHIHFKVHLSASSEATSQIYFPESVTAAVYGASPYSARGQKDTSNAADSVANSGEGIPVLATVTASGAGYVATLTVGVGS